VVRNVLLLYPSHIGSVGGMYPYTRVELKAPSHLRVSVIAFAGWLCWI